MLIRSQLKIGVILSYVSIAVNMAIQLAYTPIMIHLLGQNEYGLYTLVGSVVSYLSLFSFGFTGAYLRFYSRYQEQKDSNGIVRLNGMFIVLFGLMSAVALLCGLTLAQFTPQIFGAKLTAQELKTAQILMEILVVNIAMTFPNSLFESMVSAHEQFIFQRLIALASYLFNPLICLPLLITGHSSVMMVTVTTLITLIKLLINIWFCVKRLHISFSFSHFDFSLLREIAAFSSFLFLNMVIDQVNWSVDKFILGRVSGTSAVAIYGVGAQINSVFISLSTAVSSVFTPRVNRIAAAHKANHNREFTRLFTRVGRIQFLVLGLIASGFVFFGRYFINELYTTTEYAPAYVVVLLLILPSMVPCIQNLGIEIQRSVNKHQFRAIIYFFMALLNVIISIPLAIHYGPIGSASGTCLSLLLANGLIMNIYYQKAIGIDIVSFWISIMHLARGMIFPIVFGIIIFNTVTFHGVVTFLIWVLLYLIVYTVSFWAFGMNADEKTIVRDIFRKAGIVGRNRQ